MLSAPHKVRVWMASNNDTLADWCRVAEGVELSWTDASGLLAGPGWQVWDPSKGARTRKLPVWKYEAAVIEMIWAWVRENDSGDGSKGSHVHILLHCPATVPIGSMWRRWLKRITGHAYRRGTVHTSRIGGSLNTYATFPTVYRANLDRVLAYLCKGVRPEVGATLGLPRTEPSGLVIGKRAAICQFLRQGLSVMKLGVCNFVAETRSHAEVKSIKATKQH